MMVFQCFLFMWNAGITELYTSLNSSAFSGSHFTLNWRGRLSRPINKNILPATLNTSVVSPKGNDSVVDFFSRQYFRIDSRSILLKVLYLMNSFERSKI